MTRSNELIEDYKTEDPEPTTPEPSYDFDWNGLFERLGEEDVYIEERDYKAMGIALGKIFDWILRVDLSSKNAARQVGRNFIALAWVVDPRRFDGVTPDKEIRDLIKN